MPDRARQIQYGLPPVITRDAKVLILGSFPSVRSLSAGQYYANPRNVFWRILGKITGTDPALPYDERVRLLTSRHIALWDVIGSCRRTGSADSRIGDAMKNDVAGLLASHPGIRLIACNGSTSARFLKGLSLPETITVIRLPSTSPANARLPFREKCRAWSVLTRYL
ncbi:MAG: Uracil DNA glycosylase superfamily protein [Methanoregula sp. PtaU1.Bin051]|nr:MAG: Uracil DNA glycosylase superfamily protein [Methanoregula sp. PtaU1.Bin051]